MRKKLDLKMYPFVKLVVPLALGIITGDAVGSGLAVSWWWALTAIMFVLALAVHRSMYLQSLLLLVAVALLGATLVSEKETELLVSIPKEMVTYQAVLTSEPVAHGKVVQADLLVMGLKGTVKIKASILRDTVSHRYERLHVGDGIEAASYLEEPMNFSDATFDYARWLRLHGFGAETFIYHNQWRKVRVSLRSLSLFQRATLAARIYRQKLLGRLRNGIEGDDLAVIAAMTLGDKSLLRKDLKDDYSISGASHVLALSGLHLTVVYGLLLLVIDWLARCLPLVRRRGVGETVVLLAVWSYVMLVGFSPSVVRSATMLTVYAFVSVLNRDRLSVNTLALTAFIMLVANPLCLFDIGFQLSFMSVLSILMFYPLLFKMIPAVVLQRSVVVRWLWGMAAVSLSAQIGAAPLVAYYFGRFSTVFLVSSLIAVPGTTVILYMTLAMLLLPLSSLSGLLGQFLGRLAGWMNTSLHWLANVPGASIEGLHVSVGQVAVCYVMLLAGWLLASFYADRIEFR
ncbi:MAG: ComEC/Rec2 family competence protein [Prevotella sp.]|nr:ComEC/Rec2 family competence protein [Prevotella sp.]